MNHKAQYIQYYFMHTYTVYVYFNTHLVYIFFGTNFKDSHSW